MSDFSTQGWLNVSDVTPRIAYTASPGQAAFTVPFVFYDEADLRVYVDNVLQVLSTDYATSGALDEDGGSITLVAALAGGESVIILLSLTYEVTTHIPPSGPLDIASINLQFSKVVSMLQQIDTNRVRSLHQPDSDADDLNDLPIAATRASKFLAFDATGQPMASAAPPSAPTSAFMATLLDDADAAAARATLGVIDQASYAGLSNWHFCR